MLASDSRFRPRVADVAAKVIDGEAIIMNLSNGLYFSMDHVGATVWELLEKGHSLGEISDALGAHFHVELSTVQGDLSRLAEQLVSEGLVEKAAGQANGPVQLPSEWPSETYEPPVLNKYSDMADLLALDPPMPGLGEAPGPE